jgi:hypothetical protein
MQPEIKALVKAAEQRKKRGHSDTCYTVLSGVEGEACSCGHADLVMALAAVQSAPAEEPNRCGTCRHTSKVEPEAFVACGNRDGFYGMGVSMDDPLDGCNRWEAACAGEGEG